MTKHLTLAQFYLPALCLVLCALALARTVNAQSPSITTFDVPASNPYGTVPDDVNAEGTVVGFYFDANLVAHGFLRSCDGKLTTFDAPGAGTKASDHNGTFPLGINLFGFVVGYYNDDNLVSHGFVRSPDGQFTTLDEPDADTNPADQLGTQAIGINALGVISGGYTAAPNTPTHGFVRAPSGKYTSFDASSSDLETIPNGPVNLEGAIVGYYLDSNLLSHAFVRSPNGTIAGFVGPSSCTTGVTAGCYGNGDLNINVFGWSVGTFQDNKGDFVGHGFLRRPNGTLTVFDAPGAGNSGMYQGTIWSAALTPNGNEVAGLNDLGAVAATYLDSSNVYHGFLRSPEGTFTSFDAPGADLTAGDYNGTFPVNINNSGLIAGFYTDASYVPHGFIREPK